MFSNLRQNSQIYILHKDTTPYIEIGSVVSVSQPVPKFPVTNFMNPQELIVDIVVKVNDNNITFQKLPANLDIADQGISTGAIVITTSKEAMNSEVDSLRQKSLGIINSIDYHRKVIENCEVLLQQLNPEFAEKQAQQKDISMLKEQMEEMSKTMTSLMEANKELLTQLKSNKNENVGIERRA